MSGLDPNIQSYSSPVQGPQYVAPEAAEEEATITDTGASTIEKSKAVITPYIPPIDSPLLTPPGQNSYFSIAMSLSSIGDAGKAAANFLFSAQLQMDQITNKMLDAWNKNIREIEEQVRQMLNSPLYQALMQVQLKGDQQPSVGGIQGASSVAGVPGTAGIQTPNNVGPFSLLNAVDRMRVLEKIPPSAETSEAISVESQQSIKIPMVAAVFVGGAITMVSVEMTASVSGTTNPLHGAMDIVNRLQPVLTQNLLPDLLPMINLLAMPLVYFTSWDASIGSINNKEKKQTQATIEQFAQTVINLVGNPDALKSLIAKLPGVDKLTPAQIDLYGTFVKLILGSVAFSLMYSSDVGKIQQDRRFLGMEPQEFQGVLMGEIPVPSGRTSSLTVFERMQVTLVNIIKSNLDLLPPAQKARVLAALFDYLSGERKLDSMLDPAKAFWDVLSGEEFRGDILGLLEKPA